MHELMNIFGDIAFYKNYFELNVYLETKDLK